MLSLQSVVLVTALLATASPAGRSSDAKSKKAKDAAVATVVRAKQEFVLRVDACIPAEQCNRELEGFINAAEQKFMEACRACATEDRCEAERTNVRSGKAKRRTNPCLQ